MAVLIARIARLDCPDHWPELLPLLSEVRSCREDIFIGVIKGKSLLVNNIYQQGVRNQSEFTRKCYLNVLRHVIKTLASRRLLNQRQVFFDVTTSLFVYVVQLWNTHLQAAMEQLSAGNAESAVDTLNLARVCLKSELEL